MPEFYHCARFSLVVDSEIFVFKQSRHCFLPRVVTYFKHLIENKTQQA